MQSNSVTLRGISIVSMSMTLKDTLADTLAHNNV